MEESKFSFLYNKYFRVIIESSFAKMNEDFKMQFNPLLVDLNSYERELEIAYITFREEWKQLYLFKEPNQNNNSVDNRSIPKLNVSKLATSICLAIISKKPIKFVGGDKLDDYISNVTNNYSHKDANEIFKQSVLINYYIAINCGLSLLFFFTLAHLQEEKTEQSNKGAEVLSKMGRMDEHSNYIIEDGQDDYSDAFMKTLARMDRDRKVIDPMLVSLVFASYEENTYRHLDLICTKKD